MITQKLNTDHKSDIEIIEEKTRDYYIRKVNAEKLKKLEKWFEIKVVYSRGWRTLTIVDLTDSMEDDEVIGNEYGAVELWHITGQIISKYSWIDDKVCRGKNKSYSGSKN